MSNKSWYGRLLGVKGSDGKYNGTAPICRHTEWIVDIHLIWTIIIHVSSKATKNFHCQKVKITQNWFLMDVRIPLSLSKTWVVYSILERSCLWFTLCLRDIALTTRRCKRNYCHNKYILLFICCMNVCMYIRGTHFSFNLS